MGIIDLPVAREELIAPHGGRLVERRLDPEEAAGLVRNLPSVTLSPAEAADVRALATGAYSPLTGFVGSAEHEACTQTMRLPDGLLWPIPVCLGVPEGATLRGDRLALRDERGTALGVLDVTEVYRRDRLAEAELVFGTGDPAHPGAARVLGAPELAVAGPVRAVVQPLEGLAGRYALTPAETRASFAIRGWRRIAGFQTRNPIHRAHEYLQRCALEICDGLLLHPLVGPTKDGDVPAETRMRAYQAALRYFPAERVLLATLVAPMRYAGPREALLHALVRRNHGCTHFVVGVRMLVGAAQDLRDLGPHELRRDRLAGAQQAPHLGARERHALVLAVGQVLAEAMPPQAAQWKTLSNSSGVMPSSSGGSEASSRCASNGP